VHCMQRSRDTVAIFGFRVWIQEGFIESWQRGGGRQKVERAI
jgi:hypothetical protein